MNENAGAESGHLRQRDEALAAEGRPEPQQSLVYYVGRAETHGPPPGRFDGWVVANVLARRWVWLMFGGLLGALGFFYLAVNYVQPKFTASAQLLRFDTSAGGNDLFKTPLSAETFSGLIRSPDLLKRVGEQAAPPLPPEKLFKCIKVDPEPDSDMVKVIL